MKLQDYISETLKQIILGVKDAQEFAKDQGAIINGQDWDVYSSSATYLVYHDQYSGPIQTIEFDVEVTTAESDSAQGGIGIFVGPIGVGTKGQIDSKNSSMNHLRFNIPIKLPHQEKK
jgi:hypothetical protein